MKHTQFMREAGKLQGAQAEHGKTTGLRRLRSIILDKDSGFEKSVACLTEPERATLSSHVHLQLQRERRRCNAQAGTYDVNRHIRLYLANKALHLGT